MAANLAGNDVGRASRRAAGHPMFHRLCRAGLAARGVNYILIGALAVQIGLGDEGKTAEKKGALQVVADTPGGTVALWLLVVGFAGLALWRYAEALYGQPVPGGDKPVKRLESLVHGVVYTAVFAGALAYVLGRKTQTTDEQSKTFSAEAMSHTGGRWAVLALGLVLLAYGVAKVVTGVRHKFLETLRTGEMDPRTRQIVKSLGVVGHIARGAVFAAAGVFIAHAAITFDPDKAKGLDGTLREFAQTPAGPWLLVAVAVGLVVFGLYSLCEARWRKVETVGRGQGR
ncbi:hypothetical protein DPM19_24710 [Actinomadura craniellae]|uniref:DUF1206 domain-containing protein n=1 Tax=Actinomadura craniellae TaxID=2231787 RepID=A0A365GZY8_9ACTN|nr:DUF1206 domain-containing protein [Actinomadura craniellae]RAY12356.1 hypothetical protein DPM19_24710 [Actinomadura craniellae]